MSATGKQTTSTWQKEFADISRGFAGAFLFATPLLFTMEMWWIGEFANLWKLAAFLGFAFVANLGLAYYGGFKQEQHRLASVEQAIEAVAIGAIASAVVLFTLNRINFGSPLDAVLGKIIIQTVPLSIGATLAGIVFGGREGRQGEPGSTPASGWRATGNDVVATAVGAFFIGSSIAPTEEIPMLAAKVDIWHEILLVFVTLVITYLIVFASGFDPNRPEPSSPFQSPITETVLAYVVSLVVAFIALYFFDQIEFGSTPLYSGLVQILVLGVPAAVGGAAGRLAV